jgi:glutamine cyclotransferase
MIAMNHTTLKSLAICGGLGLILLLSSSATAPKKELQKIPETKAMQIVTSIPMPDVSPRGMVAVQNAIWTIDTKTKTLKKFDIEKNRIVSSVRLDMGEPRGLAWDGKTFWIVDNRTKTVRQFDPETQTVLRSLEVPMDINAEKAVLEAAAWDGKDLWVAYFAGWSSRILRMNVETGEVIQSMFAEGHPVALASDGKRLWMISYNEGKYTGAITQRTIMDDPVKMNLSQKIIGRTPGKEPVGIGFDGTHLWIIDRQMKTIHKVALP